MRRNVARLFSAEMFIVDLALRIQLFLYFFLFYAKKQKKSYRLNGSYVLHRNFERTKISFIPKLTAN